MRRLQTTHRPGYVLFAVLIVVVVLSLVAYQYSDAMASEYRAAVRSSDALQARLAAISGVHYAAAILADPNSASFNLTNDPSLFSNQMVGDQTGPNGGWRFSLFNIISSGDGTGTYSVVYGLSDESAKININTLIAQDPTGNLLYSALMLLPNMTADLADAIIDWVDPDSSVRPNGAEEDYYVALSVPYHCKNSPLNSVDELLLVKGMTPDLLYGTDRNRNGVQDPNEVELGVFSRGLSEYLTCYGRELNLDSTGAQRINLNGTDAKVLSEQLTSLLGQELSDYILYYRLSGKGEAFQARLPSNKVSVPVSSLRDLVQAQIDAGVPPSRRLTSTLTIVNTQIQLPAPSAQQGQPTPPTPVVACPINDATSLSNVLPLLLDKCTVSDDFEMNPRINVSNAPAEVLTALPGLTPEDVTNIIANRPGQPSSDQTASWLVSGAKMDPVKFKNIEKYVSGRSATYRVQSVGYSGKPGGPVARVEAVIEAVQGMPRIVYFRDLTDLGRGFADLPRD
jgi:type II secretory pathway component PulK